jgi:hypothetical protein
MTGRPALGIRWTIGAVSPLGFAALRLSVWGARSAFGPEAALAIYVNSLPVAEARRRTGPLPEGVSWRPAGAVPDFLAHHLDPSMAEGVAWKFAPLQVFADRFELALDNDCILWEAPPTVRRWLTEPEPRCLIAADTELAHGAFTRLTRREPRNSGIRGLPPGYDLAAALEAVLAEHPVKLRSELDEQGLQIVALDRGRRAHVVSTEDVAICSPFWPHRPELGRCGAHFIGLNAHALPFDYYGRPASEWVARNFEHHRPEIERRIGIEQVSSA